MQPRLVSNYSNPSLVDSKGVVLWREDSLFIRDSVRRTESGFPAGVEGSLVAAQGAQGQQRRGSLGANEVVTQRTGDRLSTSVIFISPSWSLRHLL